MAPAVLKSCSTTDSSPTTDSPIMVTPPSDFYGPGDYPFDGQSWRHHPENGSAHGHTNGLNGTLPGPTPPQKTMPIAIVGMACRLPGNVSSPAEFWELCSRARTGFGPIPKDRFSHDAYYHPNAGKMGSYHAQGGNFLTHVDLKSMDAPFFGLTEKEAVSMDPQQRLLLECTFEALENGGIPKHSIVGKDVGVFVGGSLAEYEHQLARDIDSMPMHQATGCAHAMQSNRISHFFDLRGPSFTADTACSASLVALHLACQSMRAGESTHAIVGSCHLNMLPEFWASFSSSRLLSDSGRSIAFDSRGTGFGRGEGCGVIVLKPLDEALRNNDVVRAVIHGSGINQDGKTPGITMPNGTAQERLINKVYRDAGISPADCGFVECHGTGTKVGDPIEATAIHNAIGQGRTARDPLYIGSIKSNIGHLEAASGIAAVIKAVMMLERGFLLPNHDFKEPNEKIPWKEWNLKVLKRQQPWPKLKKYISVNNFGFGGTNAHVVLGKAPSIQKPQPAKPAQAAPQQESTSMLRLFTNARSAKVQDAKPATPSNTKLFVMTANDKASLLAVMKKMVVYLEQRPEIFQKDLMENFAYTIGQRRSLLQWRAAIATDSSFDLIESINSDKIIPCKQSAEKPRLGFIFTGQGAQWHAMGRELYHQYPIYAAAIDRCNECLCQLGADWSLSQELLERDAKNTKVGEAHISQPSCTAVQLALVDLLRSWDIEPVAVVGHSSGEIGAAYAAGLLSFESAMSVAYHRGRLVPVLKKRHSGLNGAMTAVGGTAEEIQPLIDDVTSSKKVEGKVSVACYNSPSSLTISGDSTALTAFEDQLKSEHPDMFCRRLQVDTAYHCHHMNMIADEYRESIVRQMEQGSQSNSNEPAQFFSSLHGHRVDGLECAHAEYWVRNLTNPVRFSEALDHMVKEADLDMLVELGPHSALQGPIKQILKAAATSTNGDNGATPNRDFSKLPYSSALARGKNAIQTSLDLAGNLFMRGCFVNMEAINFPSHYHHGTNGKLPSLLTDLPTYPFNHQHKFWHEPRLAQLHRHRGSSARNDLIGLEAIYSNDLEPTWRNIVRLDDLPWLRHHEIQSVTIFPISGYAAMALEALAKWCQKKDVRDRVTDFELKDVEVLKPLVFSGGDADVEMTITLRPTDPRDPEAWMEFHISSWTQDAGWTKHCVGLAAAQLATSREQQLEGAQLSGSSLKCEVGAELANAETLTSLHGEEMYAQLSDLGVAYGPSFQGIKHSNASVQCSTADIAVIDVAHDMPSEHVSCNVIQPNLLEAIIQTYWPIALANGVGSGTDATVYLPSSIGGLKISNDLVALAKGSGTTLQAYCKAGFPAMTKGEQPRPSKASIVAAASSVEEDGKTSDSGCLIQVDDLKVSPVSGGEAQDDSTAIAAARELCYKVEWEPLEAQDSNTSSLAKLESEIVIIHGTSTYQKTLAKTLAEGLFKVTSSRANTGALGQVDCEGKVVVVLDEIDQPFLTRPTEVQFQQLKTAVLGTDNTKPPHGVLWVTNGATQPDSGMITGLSRTVRSETLLPFATLDLESTDQAQAVTSVLSVLGSVFGAGPDTSSATQDSRELEFMSRNGQVITARIENDESMNSYVQRKLDPSIPEFQRFGKDGRCLKLNYDGLSKHSTGSLHFVEDDSLNEPLLSDEIEFEVKAIGTNTSDVEGHVNSENHHLGIEASGIVTRVGEKSTTFTPGQRIAALALPVPGRQHGGMYRTRARSSTATAIHIPATLSFEDAAAMPLAYCTAYYAVVTQARVQEGQSILIQYGDSSDAVSVGHAVVWLAQMLLGSSGQVYMAVESEEQKKLVGKEYGIPQENVFLSSRRGNIFSMLHECRGPEHAKGVDAVISVGRSSIASGSNMHVAQDLWSCVAPFGCMVDIRAGKTMEGGATFSPVGNNASRANTSYFSLDMFELAAERPDVLKNVVSKVAGLVGTDKLRSLPMVKTRPLSDVEDTLKHLQSAQQLDKIVVAVDADCSILATQRTNPLKSLLRPDSTYVLIGGTGGLGRSMTRWMVSNGARNIVLVSRSASASGKVKELMNDLRSTAGANILLRRCDVADKSSVDALFRSGMTDLPPVRGVVHGSMVLKDVLFEKMTFADYTSVIESKVQGAWNLHHATSGTEMDFFVAISSTAGIVGNRGQAAYAAANTFLDSFVQYRLSQGLPAVSLDLTAVADAGYLAEAGTGESDGADRAAEVARNLGEESTMYEAEVLALLSAAIEGRTSACNHQVVTGVRIPPDRTKLPFWTTDAKFKRLREEAEAQIKQKEDEEGSSAANGGAASLSFNAMLKNAQNTAEAEDVICRGLVHKIAALLMLEESDLDVTRTLSHYPLDSLVAIEIRNFLTREFEANLQVLELLSSGSIQFLSKAVCSKSKLCQGLAA